MRKDNVARRGAENGVFRCKPSHFTQVPNSVINCDNLSLGAKGLYAVIQSYITIPGFSLSKWGLRKKCKVKKYTFDKLWKELKSCGFLHAYSKNTRNGFVWYYELLDSPCIEIPCMGYPSTGSPSMENRSILNNTNQNNTEFNNTNAYEDDDLDVPLLASKLENIINNYRDTASKTNLNPLEIEQATETFMEAITSITDRRIIHSINECSSMFICELWRKVYMELFETTAFGHPERSVANKTAYTLKIINNTIRSNEARTSL